MLSSFCITLSSTMFFISLKIMVQTDTFHKNHFFVLSTSSKQCIVLNLISFKNSDHAGH